jgi:hypothetical protein
MFNESDYNPTARIVEKGKRGTFGLIQFRGSSIETLKRALGQEKFKEMLAGNSAMRSTGERVMDGLNEIAGNFLREIGEEQWTAGRDMWNFGEQYLLSAAYIWQWVGERTSNFSKWVGGIRAIIFAPSVVVQTLDARDSIYSLKRTSNEQIVDFVNGMYYPEFIGVGIYYHTFRAKTSRDGLDKDSVEKPRTKLSNMEASFGAFEEFTNLFELIKEPDEDPSAIDIWFANLMFFVARNLQEGGYTLGMPIKSDYDVYSQALRDNGLSTVKLLPASRFTNDILKVARGLLGNRNIFSVCLERGNVKFKFDKRKGYIKQ